MTNKDETGILNNNNLSKEKGTVSEKPAIVKYENISQYFFVQRSPLQANISMKNSMTFSFFSNIYNNNIIMNNSNNKCSFNIYFIENLVISYAIYGSNPYYVEMGLSCVQQARKMYPGYRVVIWHDYTVPKEGIDRLLSGGADTIEVLHPRLLNSGVGHRGMFWRFLVFDLFPDTEVCLVRDLDSALLQREKDAVDQFLSMPDKGFHVMRDNPHHGVPILGGTWGAKRGVVPRLFEKMLTAPLGNKGEDQIFLGAHVWPQIVPKLIAHDSYTCKSFIHSRPFPNPRDEFGTFVGQICNGPQNCDKTRGIPLNNPQYVSPMECRPNPSATWG